MSSLDIQRNISFLCKLPPNCPLRYILTHKIGVYLCLFRETFRPRSFAVCGYIVRKCSPSSPPSNLPEWKYIEIIWPGDLTKLQRNYEIKLLRGITTRYSIRIFEIWLPYTHMSVRNLVVFVKRSIWNFRKFRNLFST